MPCQRHFSLQCDVGRFLSAVTFNRGIFFYFIFFYLHSRAKLSNPAVVKSFALGFLLKPFDHYLTVAAHAGMVKLSGSVDCCVLVEQQMT